MPETRISSSQPVLWRVSVAGTLVAPWWHSGSVAEDRTGSGGAVPALHYPALRCACVCLCAVCACVLCVPVCVQGQRTSCGQQHGWFGTIGSLQAGGGGTRRAIHGRDSCSKVSGLILQRLRSPLTASLTDNSNRG